MARVPQPPIPQFFEQPPAPAPSGLLVGLAAAGLFVATALGTVVREIGKRWRGIVIAHLFFLTLWMAVQVVFFATGAYWCIPGNSSTAVEWFSKYLTHVARCGPLPQTMPALQSSTASASPAPAPPRPPAPVPVPPAPPRPPSAGAAPPSASAPQTAPAFGSAQGWSGKAVQNCWRNRAVDNGDCYENPYPRRAAPPAPPPPIVRYRYPERPLLGPCRRPYDCWPDDYWVDDL